MDKAEFKSTMDEWLYTLRTTRPAPGHDRGRLSGDWWRLRPSKTGGPTGFPYTIEVIEWFRSTCSRMGIPFNLA